MLDMRFLREIVAQCGCGLMELLNCMLICKLKGMVISRVILIPNQETSWIFLYQLNF